MNNLELNKIYCESNLETMARMPDDFVDVVITSPPYNLGNSRLYDGGDVYDNYDDELSHDDYFNQTKKWIDELLRVTKYHIFWNIQEVKGNKGIIKFLHNQYEKQIKDIFIWAKTNPAPHIVSTMPSLGYEYIFCISKDSPNTRKFNHCNFSNRNGKSDVQSNILIHPSNSGNLETKGHSFAFGDWLPNHFINYYSKEGDVIYDPFMGTGTTAKSAHIYKRKFIGSEISQKYVEIANKRLEPYLTQQTLF